MLPSEKTQRPILPLHQTKNIPHRASLWGPKRILPTFTFGKWSRRHCFTIVGMLVLMMYILLDFGSSKVKHGVHSRPTDPRLAIFVLTSKKTFWDRGQAVMRTWGKKAEERGVPVYFASSVVSAEKYGFHTVDVPETDYEHIYQRTYMALEHFHKEGKYDWIMKVDDDTYVNIDQLLGALSTEDSSALRLLGHMDSGPITQVHSCFGGPGYILSKGLLEAVGPYLAECRLSVNSGPEDVLLADCIGRHKPDWFDGCLPFRNDVKDVVEDLTGSPVDDKLSIDDLMQPIGNVSWMTIIEPAKMNPPPVRILKSLEGDSSRQITTFNPPLSEFPHAPLLERFVGLPDQNIKEIDLSPDSANQRHWHTFYNRYWSLSEAYTFHKVLPQDMYRLHDHYQMMNDRY